MGGGARGGTGALGGADAVTCPECKSAHFCCCRVEATPGLSCLAPIRATRGKPARGSWGPAYRLARAVVERVERTPEGTLVSVRFGNGVRRKVRAERLRPASQEVTP
jgi:hypothetical protein